MYQGVYLLGIFYVPGAVLGSGDTMIDESNSFSSEAHHQMGDIFMNRYLDYNVIRPDRDVHGTFYEHKVGSI